MDRTRARNRIKSENRPTPGAKIGTIRGGHRQGSRAGPRGTTACPRIRQSNDEECPPDLSLMIDSLAGWRDLTGEPACPSNALPLFLVLAVFASFADWPVRLMTAATGEPTCRSSAVRACAWANTQAGQGQKKKPRGCRGLSATPTPCGGAARGRKISCSGSRCAGTWRRSPWP